MIKVAIITQLFCSLILIDACKMPSESQNTEIKMLLSAQGNKILVEKTLTLLVTVKNNSKKDIWVLDFPEFSTDENSVFQLMIEKDGQSKISPVNLLRKKRIPKASDYKKLEPNGTLKFSSELDFTTLVDDYKNIGENKKNTDFGEYAIKVHFTDNYLIKKNALKNLTSNRIQVNYVP